MEKRLNPLRAMALALIVLLVALLGSSYGYLRVLIGSLVFLGLLSFGFKYWRDVGLIPPEVATEDVRGQDLRYICSVCGLELLVEVAAHDKAPRHCGEAMESVTGSGQTSARP